MSPKLPKTVNQSKPSEITDKLRFLCLHGYRQNGDSFKSKIGSFRKHVNKYAEFVFVSAPHVAPPLDASSTEPPNEEQRSWWFNKADGTFSGRNTSAVAIGFEESVRVVEKAWKEEGPFQGLLGFSQGACFVGLLCSLSQRGMTTVRPDYAIMCAGFRSGSLAHLAYYEDSIPVTSVHVFGESDEIIPQAFSESLAASFREPKILKHPGGHFFAAAAAQRPFYVEQFQNMLQEYLEAKELSMASAANSIDVVEDENDEESS